MRMVMNWAYGTAEIDKHGVVTLPYVKGFYNPFDRYYSGGAGRSLYLEFASLDADNPQAIEAFASQYGVLGLSSRRDNRPVDIPEELYRAVVPKAMNPRGQSLTTVRDGVKDWDHLDEIQEEIRLMRLVLSTWEACRVDSFDRNRVAQGASELWTSLLGPAMIEHMGAKSSGEFKERSTLHYLGLPDDELKAAGMMNISMFVSAQTTGHVSSRLVVDHDAGAFAQQLYAHTLLAAMYWMIASDMSGPHQVRRCDNELCGQFYIPSRPSNLYCSDACQARQRVRRYRRRQAAKEA